MMEVLSKPIKMNFLKFFNLTRLTYTLFGLVFLYSGLIINVAQIILFILLRPFSKNLFRKINYYLSYSLYSQIVFLQQYWADVKVTLHAVRSDKENYFGKEHAILIMNHSYEIDWIIGWILCDSCHILGNVKTFAKIALQYIPTIGYSWRMGGSIFVERNWQKDQQKVENLIQNLATYKDPLWLLLAAEGTRFTEEKHATSLAFARENGLPELRYHLTPRTKGFTATVPIMRKSMGAIYNINVAIKSGDVRPTLTNILLGKSINAEFFVERIPVEDLPESEADLADWLHALYKRKDDLMHSYLTTGIWTKSSNPKYESFLLPRKPQPAVNFVCWFFLIVVSTVYYFIHSVLNRSYVDVVGVLVVICSFTFLLERLIKETKISSSSSYGTAKVFFNDESLKKQN